MSDVTTGSAFNPQFFMQPPWWLGRVESKETWKDNIQGETFTNIAQISGWGHRYKVRVFNWHTGELDKLPPNDMAYCQVIMPVTAGSGHAGATQTPSIEAGSVVFGFFMDGMAGQEGYIMGVLGNSNNNVPKERGSTSPNQPKVVPTQGGGSATVKNPPVPAIGPGSLANAPVPPNVDQLSTPQLIKLLRPDATPSSEVFKAASEARDIARKNGASAAEVERQALIATVKASRQPRAYAGGAGNCNLGYQQFNNTYTDGDPLRAALVPDDRILGNIPLSITEALHIETVAKTEQDLDSKKKIPLSDVCKSNNSQTKGIQRILKNLLNSVEYLKKKFNQVSAFSTDVSEFSTLIQEKVFGAIEEISRYAKDIINDVRGYILNQLSDKIKTIAPFLFPSEIPKLYQGVEKGTTLINCLFNKIIAGLKDLLSDLISDLLDQFVNAPLCAAEELLGGIVDSTLAPIASTLESAFDPINSLMNSITQSLEGGLELGGINVFSALEFIPGILQFFSCDEDKECVKYNEISQDGSALPGGDATSTPSNSQTNSPTGSGSNSSQSTSANITLNTGTGTTYENSEITKKRIRDEIGDINTIA